MNAHIAEQTATGEQVSAIVAMIEPCLVNVPRGLGIIALLSMVLVLQNPDITPVKLQDGVRDVSRFICLILDETEGEPELMN